MGSGWVSLRPVWAATAAVACRSPYEPCSGGLLCRHWLGMLVAAGVAGCDARTEVAKDHVLAHVDKLLGEIDVRKKEAEIGVRKAEAALDEVKKGKIEAKVRSARYADRLAEVEAKVAGA